jgi:hypothetical protein
MTRGRARPGNSGAAASRLIDDPDDSRADQPVQHRERRLHYASTPIGVRSIGIAEPTPKRGRHSRDAGGRCRRSSRACAMGCCQHHAQSVPPKLRRLQVGRSHAGDRNCALSHLPFLADAAGSPLTHRFREVQRSGSATSVDLELRRHRPAGHRAELRSGLDLVAPRRQPVAVHAAAEIEAVRAGDVLMREAPL